MLYVIQFIDLLVSGVSSIISFILGLGTIVSYSVAVLPDQLATYLLVSFGIIVSVRVLELLP